MKTYILTTKIRIEEEQIRRARKWARRRGYDYKEDIAHMVLDYITDGSNISIITSEIEEVKSLAR